jgi:hypothetical protein
VLSFPMSKGSGRIERRIGELFAATTDRALSVGEVAAYAFELTDGAAPDRKQRLSATRAAHRLLHRAAGAAPAMADAMDRLVAETALRIGRQPRRHRDSHIFFAGTRLVIVDPDFAEAMHASLLWREWSRAANAWKRCRPWLPKRHRWDADDTSGAWQATEADDRRLWFHRADRPIRLWAVSIEPEGVSWAEAEVTRIDNTYVRARYAGSYVRLDRDDLAGSWTVWRGVFFTGMRSGYAAAAFDQMWRERYWRPGTAPPPSMQMPLADAIKLLGVPADFTREDIIAAFRRASFRCHPDHGGTEEQFIKLTEARDRLLASLGTREKPPKMPTFTPKGARLRYGVWRPQSSTRRLGGYTRPLIG